MASNLCQVCGPNPQEAPTVLCAPCALALPSGRSPYGAGVMVGIARVMLEERMLRAAADELIGSIPRMSP